MSKLIVIRDPTSRAVEEGSGTVFNPETMKVIENDYARSLQMLDPKLMFYHNTSNGNFGIGAWVFRPGQGHATGIMVEVEVIDGDPYSWPHKMPSMEVMKRKMVMGQAMVTEALNKLDGEKHQRKLDAITGNEKRRDLERYARSRRMERIADGIKHGTIPISDREVDKSQWKL